MAVSNFSEQFFPKRLVQIWNSQKWPFQIFPDNFPQKDKFGMAKNGIFTKKTLFCTKSVIFHTFSITLLILPSRIYPLLLMNCIQFLQISLFPLFCFAVYFIEQMAMCLRIAIDMNFSSGITRVET